MHYPKLTFFSLVLAVSCGAIAFVRYSLDALFAGALAGGVEVNFLGDNFVYVVVGGGALLGAIATSLVRHRVTTITPKPLYRVAI